MSRHHLFAGTCCVAAGSAVDIALAWRALDPNEPTVLAFDDSGRQVDFDLRGSAEAVAERLGETGAGRAGRPKLGVTAREVTLMPRHWDWLAGQRGGASAALRRLVEAAIRADHGAEANQARDAGGRFLLAMAGDLVGYEEATRALYRDDRAGYRALAEAWPEDIRTAAESYLAAWLAGDPAGETVS